MFRRVALAVIAALIPATILAQPAYAGSPHFVNNATSASISGNTLTVTGKEAGLGDEAAVHIVLSATAECINGGGRHPQAANKTSVSTSGDFPVQNGKADFTLSVTASFQPDCTRSMTVAFADVTVTDTTNGISLTLH